MTKQVKLAVGTMAIALLGSSASATTLLEDNFDSYASQSAFNSIWTQVGATASGTLSSLQSVSSPNSVNFSTVAQRNEHSFAESGLASQDNIVRFSFDFYDSNDAASPYRQYAAIQDSTAPTGSGQLIALGLNNNLTSSGDGGNFYMARILGYNGGAFFKLNNDATLLRKTGWHNLAVEISDANFNFYVDGSLAETVSQSGLTLRSYDVVRLGSGVSSLNEAFIDNVKVASVPEPSALALGLLGGLGLLIVRNRRR